MGVRAAQSGLPNGLNAPAPVAIVSTHHEEDYSWACTLVATHDNVDLFIYDTGVTPLPAELLASPRVTVLDKTGPLAPVPFFYGVFDFCERHYHRLPELMLFLHGHDTSWHQRLSIATLMQMAGEIIMDDPSVEYLALNDRVYDDWYTYLHPLERSGDPNTSSILHDVTVNWKAVASLLHENGDTPPPKEIVEIHAAQALVARCRIQARPRAVWARLCEHVRRLHFHTSADYCLEGCFHYIFGEPWRRPFVCDNLMVLAQGKLNELELRCAPIREASRARREAAYYGFADSDDADVDTAQTAIQRPSGATKSRATAEAEAARAAAATSLMASVPSP